MITVQQMIKELQQMPQEATIEVMVRQFNKVYPVAYAPLESVEGYGHAVESPWNESVLEDKKKVRLEISLPKYMHIVTRKL